MKNKFSLIYALMCGKFAYPVGNLTSQKPVVIVYMSVWNSYFGFNEFTSINRSLINLD